MFAATISVVSLLVSLTTAWLSLFRRGTIEMTQPTVIFFGPDMPGSQIAEPLPKVYLRTLLFATAKRGRIIESLHVAIARNETHQNFNVWVYGNEKLVRGSGLFVGETGVEANHHFLVPRDASSFRFVEGQYQLEVFAHLLGDRKRIRLFAQTLTISQGIAAKLETANAGVYFDWGPDSLSYIPHVEDRPPSLHPDTFLNILHGIAESKE